MKKFVIVSIALFIGSNVFAQQKADSEIRSDNFHAKDVYQYPLLRKYLIQHHLIF
jgi:hypothetical protein